MQKIPKLIHCCWFGSSPLSPLAKRCMESWEIYLPEYDIRIWSESNVNLDEPIKRRLYLKKQWAFLSDIVRFEALYEYGGIYLDVDVEAVKDFSPILNGYDFIAGYETSKYINAAVLLSTQGNEIVKGCLDEVYKYYDESTELLEIPKIITPYFLKKKSSSIYLAPKEVFYPYNPYDRDRDVKQLMFSDISSSTLTIHHYQKSWNFGLIDSLIKKFRSLINRVVKNESI